MPSPSVPEFWQLAASSGLFSPAQLASHQDAFHQIRGAASQGNARTLCEWLIDRRALTRFQSDVLLLGQAGPFRYGDYLILDRVRSGRLRGLFRAVHGGTQQQVLLRFLSGPAGADPQRLATATAAARVWSEIGDEHVSSCIELLDLGIYKFLVVEGLNGCSAAEQLRSQGRMSPQNACAAAQSVALGLAELHRRGMVHGDVRPENVWLSDGTHHAPRDASPHAERDEYSPRLLGFPLTRDPVGPLAGLDESTVDYAAPELAEQGSPTPLTDIYGLGCTLYELLTGQPPFPSGPLRQPLAEKMNRHATEPIVPLEQSGPMPEGLNRVVSFMMAKNPAVRYPDMAAVLAALMPYAPPSARRNGRTEIAAIRQFCRQRARGQGSGMRGQGSGVRDEGSAVRGQGSVARDQALPMVTAQSAGGLGFPLTPSVAPTVATSTYDHPAPNTAQFIVTQAPSTPAVAPIVTASAARADRKRRLWIAGGIVGAGALLVTLLTVILILRTRDDKNLVPPEVTAPKTPDATPPTNQADPPDNLPPAAMPDDGRSIWTSPTHGAAPQIRYVASEIQILMVLRPQALLNSPHGRQTMDALGPAGVALLKWIEAQTGMKPEAIDRLDIAFYETIEAEPLTSLVAYVKQRPAEAALVAAWGNPTPVEQGGQRYFQQGELCRYLPPDRKDVIVIAQRPQLAEILTAGASIATLDPYLQQLVATGDVSRHATFFFLPIYVRAARETLYPGPLAPLREAFDDLLGPADDVLAGAVSFELSEPLFAELRVLPPLNKRPIIVARELHERISQWSQALQRHLVSLTISAYSRDTLAELPFMLQSVDRQTRYDARGRIAVLRCLLPGAAAANLTLAADLLLLETAGTASGSSTPPPVSRPKSVWDKLKHPVTLSFERDSLENALKQLSGEIGVKIEILGNDLKLDGITKNQPVGLDLKNKPAEAVLGEIMLQANPDRTVKNLSDDVQKLVYVVKPAAAGGEDVILITTRAKAAERGELPTVFKK